MAASRSLQGYIYRDVGKKDNERRKKDYEGRT